MDELEQIATRYLLGELSEQEQAALEESYFRDPKVFDQVLQVESELVDAYARGQLSTEMRERFEQSYLKDPSRRNRVEFAKSLTTRIDERDASVTPASEPQSAPNISWWQNFLGTVGGRRPMLRFSMAFAAVLILLAGIWIFFNIKRQAEQKEAAQHREQPTPAQPGVTPPQQEQQQVAQTPPETSQPSPNSNKTPVSSTVTLALTVGGVRSATGGPTQTLVIPRDKTQAQILLNLKDNNYATYRVSLQKIGGPEVFTQTKLKPRSVRHGARFVFEVPTTRLTSGDYVLSLGGITPTGEVDELIKSLFRVEKK